MPEEPKIIGEINDEVLNMGYIEVKRDKDSGHRLRDIQGEAYLAA